MKKKRDVEYMNESFAMTIQFALLPPHLSLYIRLFQFKGGIFVGVSFLQIPEFITFWH